MFEIFTQTLTQICTLADPEMPFLFYCVKFVLNAITTRNAPCPASNLPGLLFFRVAKKPSVYKKYIAIIGKHTHQKQQAFSSNNFTKNSFNQTINIETIQGLYA